jgi:hypothetical protein
MAETSLGDIARAGGEPALAERHYERAAEQATHRSEIARICERLAAIKADREPEEARRLLARADELRERHRLPIPPIDRDLVTETRRRLG